MAESDLYKVLSGLNATDGKLWSKLKSVSGALADSVSTLNSDLTSLVSTTSGVLDDRITSEVSTLNGTIESVSGTLDTAISTASGNLHDEIIAASGDLSNRIDGVEANAALYELSALQEPTAGYASTYQLVKVINGNKELVDNSIINIPKDQFLSAAVYNVATESLDLTFAINGAPNLTSIPVSSMVHEYVSGNGITVGENDVANGSSISIKLADGHESFLTVGAAGLNLSGVQDAINDAKTEVTTFVTDGFEALSGRMDTAEAGLGDLSGALTNYLSGSAVTNKFAEVDGRLDAVEGATTGGLSGVAANDHIVIGAGTAQQVVTSDYTLGDGEFDDTPSSTKVATEAGAAAYTNAAVDAALSGLANNNIVLGDGNDANKVKDSGVVIVAQGDETTVQMNPESDVQVPTSKAVAKYVNDGLADLLTQIQTLQGHIDNGTLPA